MSHAEVTSAKRGLAKEPASMFASGTWAFPQFFHGEQDLLRDSVHLEVAHDIVLVSVRIVLPSGFNASTLKDDLRELIGIEKIGATQVTIALRVVRVDASHRNGELESTG